MLQEAFRASLERSRARRIAPEPATPAPGRRARVALALLAVGAPLVAATLVLAGDGTATRPLRDARLSPPARLAIDRHADRPRWPAPGAPGEARKIARRRGGLVSFAAMGPGGHAVGFHENRRYVSASVVKAMLLVAELSRLDRTKLPLDDGTRATLRAMITYSDNDAADQIYYRVGDAGLYAVAKRAEMPRFTVMGYWANAQITAADTASFMWRLDRLLDVRRGGFGSELLAGIVDYQRWGLAEAVPKDARLRFKGGWRSTGLGQLVHQAARVDRDGRRYAVAVLTDGQPSMEHAIGTVRLIGEQLIRRDRPPRRRPSAGGSGS